MLSGTVWKKKLKQCKRGIANDIAGYIKFAKRVWTQVEYMFAKTFN
jgi:hypothetical protein